MSDKYFELFDGLDAARVSLQKYIEKLSSGQLTLEREDARTEAERLVNTWSGYRKLSLEYLEIIRADHPNLRIDGWFLQEIAALERLLNEMNSALSNK